MKRQIMNIAIASFNLSNYQSLHDITWKQNKIKYAERHGYKAFCKTENFYNLTIGFEKIWLIRDLFNENPELDWIWFTGCDTLVTNMTIKLEDIIDNDYHFIIATDCNGINADSFLIRNSSEGKAYIQMIMDKYDDYKNHSWAEQQVMIDTEEQYKDIIKLVPQRDINSYNCSLYPLQPSTDRFGNSGNWQPGDFHIHWPGTSLGHRIDLANYYLKQVIE
jgi:hypothetical protein